MASPVARSPASLLIPLVEAAVKGEDCVDRIRAVVTEYCPLIDGARCIRTRIRSTRHTF